MHCLRVKLGLGTMLFDALAGGVAKLEHLPCAARCIPCSCQGKDGMEAMTRPLCSKTLSILRATTTIVFVLLPDRLGKCWTLSLNMVLVGKRRHQQAEGLMHLDNHCIQLLRRCGSPERFLCPCISLYRYELRLPMQWTKLCNEALP